MLVEFYAKNSATSDGLVNGVNGTFKDYTRTYSKSFIWIYFENPIIWFSTKLENFHLNKQFPRLHKSWTPIEWKIVEIQIGSNHNRTIIKIQYPIQLAATKLYIMHKVCTI